MKTSSTAFSAENSTKPKLGTLVMLLQMCPENFDDVKKDVGMEREVDSDDFLLLRKSHSQAGSAIQYTYCQVKDLF